MSTHRSKASNQQVSLPPAVKEALLRFIKAVAEADAQRDHSKIKE
jgi:hypothetical protein